MDTLLLTTSPSSETVASKKGKTVSDAPATGNKAPAAKRDRKTAPATTEVPAIGKDTQPGAEDPKVAEEIPVTVKDTEPTAQEPTVTSEAPAAVTDAQPAVEEPTVPDSPAEVSGPEVTKPKKPTKADLAKAIYDEAVKDPTVTRKDIIARFRKEAGLTTSGAASYYYKFQQESGQTVEKGPTKMDKAREVFQALTDDGKSRKEIIAALIKDVGLTKAGASTYFQALKKQANKPTE